MYKRQELALTVAESLLACKQIDPDDLWRRFVKWYQSDPLDVGLYTSMVLKSAVQGLTREEAIRHARENSPLEASNGSLMRCWAVALAHWNDREKMLRDSAIQSMVTHTHPDCVAASIFINAMIYELIHGADRHEALTTCLKLDLPDELHRVILAAPNKRRNALRNTGWVLHSLESVIWGLMTTESFEDALIQVVNLGSDSDTSGAVLGAVAGAYYGLDAIPSRWLFAIQGVWLPRTGITLHVGEIITLADRLAKIQINPNSGT